MATQSSSNSNALKDAITARKASLEAELKAFETSNVDKLFAEREQLTAKLAEVEAKITELVRHLGLPNGEAEGPARRAARGPGKKRRTRTSSEEIRNRVMQALSEQKHGLSQKEISASASLPYGTIAAYLKANASSFKSTGKLKGKRYFLK